MNYLFGYVIEYKYYEESDNTTYRVSARGEVVGCTVFDCYVNLKVHYNIKDANFLSVDIYELDEDCKTVLEAECKMEVYEENDEDNYCEYEGDDE